MADTVLEVQDGEIDMKAVFDKIDNSLKEAAKIKEAKQVEVKQEEIDNGKISR